MTSPSRQPSSQPRHLALDPLELRPQRQVTVLAAAADLRKQLEQLALAGIVTLTSRGGDLVCGVPERLGALAVDWIRIFSCGHVSRWCVYRSDCEALTCPVCVEAGALSAVNASDLSVRLAHIGSLAQPSRDAARCVMHQSGEL